MPRTMLSLEQALSLQQKEVRQLYKHYANSGFASLLSLLDFDKDFVKAQGVKLWDRAGNEYLDFLGGYGALNLGHNHPSIIQAIDKVKGLPVLLQASLNKLVAALAHNLASITPGNLKHSFFCNSGAEAVEAALKLARAATGKKRFLFCQGAFHGKTFGALSVTGRDKYKEAFRPLLPGCSQVPFGDLDALEESLQDNDVAAFIVEPIQGEGGVIVPPPGYLKGAEQLCRRSGALLIIDEIQTGLGRTGFMFACEEENVSPDVICLSKSLGGGLMPLGAIVTTEDAWKKAYGGMEKCLLHTSTFGGNTLAAAAGIAALEVIVKEDLPGQAAEKGRYFKEKLLELNKRYGLLKDVRGKGLLLGIEFASPEGILNKISGNTLGKLSHEYLASLVAGELLNRFGIITAYTLNNPNVIRLEPPLIVSYEEIDYVLSSLEKIFESSGSFLKLAMRSGRTVFSSLLKRN